MNTKNQSQRIAWLGILLFTLTSCGFKRIVVNDSGEKIVLPPRSWPTLIAVGDVMLGGKAQKKLDAKGFSFPFEHVKKSLSEGSVVFANLEMALTDREDAFIEKQFNFKNDGKKVAQALRKVGIDGLALANNHSMDFGENGLKDTLNHLKREKLFSVGAGINEAMARASYIKKVGRQRFGFLAYSNTLPKAFYAGPEKAGTAFGHAASIKADVMRLAKQAENVIVSFHWGGELESELRPYQKYLAKLAIDAGADIVVGHHPHVLQGIQRYKDGIILYSLGNFVFTTYSNNVHYSAIARASFHQGKVKTLEITPLEINNFKVKLQPKIAQGEHARKVYQNLKELSKPLKTKLSFYSDRIYWYTEELL